MSNPAKPKRKQLSGAAKKRRKAERAASTRVYKPGVGPLPGVLLPPIPTMQDLASLTGTARESATCYREWRFGRISRDDYLTAVRGLSEHKNILVPMTQADQVAAIHELLKQIQQRGGQVADYAALAEGFDAPSEIGGES